MPYALITGASKGIGHAFAVELAKQKHDVLLVARSGDLLEQLASELAATYGIKASTLAIDLSAPGAVGKVVSWIEAERFDIDILINNAGYGLWGKFTDIDWTEQEEMMRLNMYTLTQLSYQLIPHLQQNKKAYILNVASTTAYQAIPTLGVYAATKAYVVSFTRALSYELKGSNISVTCLSPGTTRTDFINRSRMHHVEEMAKKAEMSPVAVASFGLRKMYSRKTEVIPGFINKLGAFLSSHAPKWLTEKTAASIYKKR